MILAAGRGQRMRPLTDTVPKPLLEVGGRALIVRQIEALVAAEFHEIVINHAWLGERLEAALGDGSRFGARIAWSREGSALETAGGIATALPLLGDEPFVVVSGDIHSDYDYRLLRPIGASIAANFATHAAHLVLVANPAWHPRGDMALRDGRIVRVSGGDTLTYANIAVFHPRAFDDIAPHRVARLFPWAYRFADEDRMTGSVHDGAWDNVGDPAQLAALDARLRDD
jgi:MurNAc alpha-1-phosphate uridylyltransferase